VVEFVDFECPFCRMMNDDLAPVVERHRDRVRVVRKQVPLVRMHPHALAAAAAAVCADQMGKGDEVAAALFKAPPEGLTGDGCVELAARAGLSPSRFRDCMTDAKTTVTIRSDVQAFMDSGETGVPVVWIDDRRFEGSQPPDTLRRAVEEAIDAAQ
jgi:predicted DsbA family dithiol-disulfide isomerase